MLYSLLPLVYIFSNCVLLSEPEVRPVLYALHSAAEREPAEARTYAGIGAESPLDGNVPLTFAISPQ